MDAKTNGGPGPQSGGKPGQKSSLRLGAPQQVFLGLLNSEKNCVHFQCLAKL